jgi:hypothetical protein
MPVLRFNGRTLPRALSAVSPASGMLFRSRLLRSAKITLLAAFLCTIRYDAAAQDMKAKVLVGYQGWFRCPDDGSPHNSWSHWSRGTPAPDTLSIDLYPDVSELSGRSLCALPGMTIHGKQAYVFSSFARETVEKHFEWMKTYGIDGALLQRFVGDIASSHTEGDVVLRNVMASAQDHDRVFAIEYDLSGSHPDTVLQQLQQDWTYLTGTVGVTASPAYLTLQGAPVVSLWGLGLAGSGSHIVDPKLAVSIIQWFHDVAHVKVIGGTPSGWGSLSGDSVRDPAWAAVYAQLDIVQPWTVGRYGTLDQVDAWKRSHLAPDIALARKNHQIYMPVIFPGFSWHNLNRDKPANQIPRLGGEFLWRQAYNARVSGAAIIKIAMFDEVNEGTAILKAAPTRADAPAQGYWLTLDADGEKLPNDWYLRLAGEIGRMFRGETPATPAVPKHPGPHAADR